MVGIGIRVHSNTQVYYCIIESTDDGFSYLSQSSINVPQAVDWPEALQFIRNTILDILDQYKVDSAVIRTAELISGMAGGEKRFSNNTALIQRSYIEGVLQECLASATIGKYLAGPIVKINPVLNLPHRFKEYADAAEIFPYYPSEGDGWARLSLEKRESALSAYAALNL